MDTSAINRTGGEEEEEMDIGRKRGYGGFGEELVLN
jgi:hypothetical protein